MRTDNDYNSAGFLALILIGIMLVVAGLVLMSDAARSDKATQVAVQRATVLPSRMDEPRFARF